MKGDYFPFQVGAFSCFSLSDGYHSYPVPTIYSNVPIEQVEAELKRYSLPLDIVTTPYSFPLVQTGQHNVLVDTGAGDMSPTTGRLVESIAHAGLEPEQIDTIVITHGHPDHIGGLIDERGRPVYPNAHYYLTREEWTFWFSAEAEARTTPFFYELARKSLELVKERIELVDGEREILPGVRIVPAFGHTPGHATVWFESQGKSFVFTSDTAIQPLHLKHPEWVTIYDLQVDKVVNSIHKIFGRAAQVHALVLAQHFPPFPSLGTVTKQDDHWTWEPVQPCPPESGKDQKQAVGS